MILWIQVEIKEAEFLIKTKDKGFRKITGNVAFDEHLEKVQEKLIK